MPKSKQAIKVMARLTSIGREWPKGAWVYVAERESGYWYQANGKPTNEDGSSLRREDDELSESEANERGIYRC